MTTLVQEYFTLSSLKYPDKTAVSCQEDTITFRNLDAFSNAFARELLKNGVNRQSFVPFFLNKSINSIKAILSILKSDSAYVPIDINSPSQRLLSILKNTNATVLVVDDASKPILESLIDENERPVLLNISQFRPGDTSAMDFRNLSIDIAYVLFTSGSTGTPKGVMIPHKAIIDYIDWCVKTYQLTEKDQISNHAPLYFDNSTFDLYTAFKTGATLHLVHDELNSVLPSLIKWIDKQEVTTFFCVPSVLTLFIKSRRLKDDSFQKLRHIICAGEALPPEAIRFMMEKYPHIQFTNMYGPTEITVDCSYHVIHNMPDAGQKTIPIGKVRKNMELFVRDSNGKLTQKAGAKGELLVRGTSVGYGYLGDKQKTQASFIQNPLNQNFHDPLYCTGDNVEIEANGDFIFIGRADDQIKYLGYRIELGEIEAALRSIKIVTEGVVVFRKEDENNPYAELAALVHLHEGDINQLTEELKSRLPGYMVPTRIKSFEDEFPITANGKYDRKQILNLILGE